MVNEHNITECIGLKYYYFSYSVLAPLRQVILVTTLHFLQTRRIPTEITLPLNPPSIHSKDGLDDDFIFGQGQPTTLLNRNGVFTEEKMALDFSFPPNNPSPISKNKIDGLSSYLWQPIEWSASKKKAFSQTLAGEPSLQVLNPLLPYLGSQASHCMCYRVALPIFINIRSNSPIAPILNWYRGQAR